MMLNLQAFQSNCSLRELSLCRVPDLYNPAPCEKHAEIIAQHSLALWSDHIMENCHQFFNKNFIETKILK